MDSAPAQKPKLLDRIRNTCRLRHYSLCTEQAYVHWAKKFILYRYNRNQPFGQHALNNFFVEAMGP
jgi:hypothetical protein